MLANVGVPMLFVVAPVFVLSLLPIILVEAAVVARLIKRPFRRCLLASTSANLLSTLIGVPLAWIGLFAIEMVVGSNFKLNDEGGLAQAAKTILYAPWIGPIRDEQQLLARVCISAIILNVPFFLVSWWSELWVWRKAPLDTEPRRLRSVVMIANLVSYALLTGFWLYELLAA